MLAFKSDFAALFREKRAVQFKKIPE
jgi:hypothetical protein